MFSVPNGKPGQLPTYSAIPRELFLANRQFAQFIASPATIDGTLSSNPGNAPFTWILFAGTMMGRVTTSGKYANSVLGFTTAVYSHNGGASGTITTDVNTAVEIVRRIGTSGNLKVTGPGTAGGSVNQQNVTFSAVNTTTGVISIQSLAIDFISGSLIQPADGSEFIVTLLCDAWGKKVTDQLNSTRVDVLEAQLLAAGGTINVATIVNYPADASLKAWIKASIRVNCPGVNFSDDFA